jgi:hypothetical protein
MVTDRFADPAMRTAFSVVVSYSLILLAITLVAFVVPWLVFSATSLGV